MAKNEAKVNNKDNKNKKSFFKGFKAELKKVIWPTPKQLVNNTTAVVAIVLITAAIVFVLDLTFETMNKHGIDRIKEVIEASDSATDEVDDTDETTDDIVEGENVEGEVEGENSTENQGQEDEVEANNEETDTENTVE